MSGISLARSWSLASARIGSRGIGRPAALLPVGGPRRESLSGSDVVLPPPPSYFRILALESSADDTAAACVDSNRRILSNVIIKQHEIHGATAWTGGARRLPQPPS
jgi:hypothetical protein